MSNGSKKIQEANEPLNPFKLINNMEELPPELKDEVMATISSALLVTDLTKLFSLDMVRTAGKMLDPNADTNES